MSAGSPFLTFIAHRFPQLAQEINQEDYLKNIFQEVENNCQNDSEIEKLLRIFRLKVAYYLAQKDLTNQLDLFEITQTLTKAATHCVQRTLKHLYGEDYNGLFILAMGKMGAGELNYSSDIDLIVLYDPILSKISQEAHVKNMQRFIKILQERTSEGYVYRVDMRLRPDPSSTPLVLATPQALAYYAKIGQTWERAAHIKANVIAGDLKAGQAYLKALNGFIWRKYLDLAAIQEIHAMKNAIHAFRGHDEIAVAGHNLKLGRGGIREIEFFVQCQQLIGGGRVAALRARETFAALDALVTLNWVTQATREKLKAAYIFLRTLEHRLQMQNDEQTHSLPKDETALREFARFAGFKSLARFEKTLLKHLHVVENAYAQLFVSPPETLQNRLDFESEKPPLKTLNALKNWRFNDPKQIYARVLGWKTGLKSPRALQDAMAFLPVLLQNFGQTGQGDIAFAAFDRLLTTTRNPLDLLMLLKRDPALPRLFAHILGTAPRLAQLITQRVHVLDALFEPAFFKQLPSKAQLEANLSHSLQLANGEEEVLDRLRIFAQEQSFLISIKLLSDSLPLEKAGEYFSQLAQVLLDATFNHCLLQHHAQYGEIRGEKIAILAFGKLGSREMNAGSDIDFILLYEGEGETSNGTRALQKTHYFARFMQRFITTLTAQTSEGRLYEVDMRLRPSGRAGPLATAFSGFTHYQRQEAEGWERLALTRARVVCATSGFAEEVNAAIAAILSTSPPFIFKETAAMRRLIAQEKGEDNPFMLKTAKGGLIDLEFIAQALKAKYGHTPATNPREILAEAKKYLNATQRETLVQSYDLQNALMQILRVCLPPTQQEIPEFLHQQLAKVANEPDFKTLHAKLEALQRETREIFKTVIKAEG